MDTTHDPYFQEILGMGAFLIFGLLYVLGVIAACVLLFVSETLSHCSVAVNSVVITLYIYIYILYI